MRSTLETPERVRPATIDRLSGQDFANLVVEAPDTPMHMAVIAIIDGRGVRDLGANDLVNRARSDVEARLGRLPELRHVLYSPRLPAGRPVWIDDPDFSIERHVLTACVPAPGGETELLTVSRRVLERLLNREHPLWELWVLTGLRHDRFAVLLKIHHSVTDGLGMLRIANVLFDAAPGSSVPEPSAWSASPPPSWTRLTSSVAFDAARGLWGGIATLRHPARLARSAAGVLTTFGSVAGRTWAGRRAALRRPIEKGRKLAAVHMDLDTVRRVAHRHGAKVNDVVLELAAAGVGAALRARGLPTPGVVLRALVAVNPPDTATTELGNRAGAVMVALPADSAHDADRLREIAIDSRRARRWQRPAVVERFLVGVARVHMARFLSRHQGTIDLAVSNLKGPSAPLYFHGCRLVDAIPVTPISGNVTIDFCALSYAGNFTIAVLADATSWPDLDVAVDAMHASWDHLRQES